MFSGKESYFALSINLQCIFNFNIIDLITNQDVIKLQKYKPKKQKTIWNQIYKNIKTGYTL